MGSTKKSRRQLIEEALEARQAESGESETLTIEWRGRASVRPVINLPVQSIALNPASHRIKADIESHDDRDALAQPLSGPAQQIIEAIISRQPGYADLRENISLEGQRESGVITIEGILVNANRRAVALREIDSTSYIKVAVLPSDATAAEIVQLELKLQMQQEFKQDYSFTNELLFIDDLAKQGYTTEQIARELRWKEAEVSQHRRMLATIRDLQKRCGEGLKLIRFDENKREIMIELSKKLHTLEKSDPTAAERLLECRALAMLTDIGYELIREIDEDFMEEHLLEVAREAATLEEDDAEVGSEYIISKHMDDIVAPSTAGSDAISGVEVLGSSEERVGGTASTRLLDFYFESLQRGIVEVPGSNGMTYDTGLLSAALNSLIQSAAMEARENRLHRGDLGAPAKYLKEAQKKIKFARDRLQRMKDDPRFKVGDYQYRARKLMKDAEDMNEEAQAL